MSDEKQGTSGPWSQESHGKAVRRQLRINWQTSPQSRIYEKQYIFTNVTSGPIINNGAADGVSATTFFTFLFSTASHFTNRSLAFVAGILFSWWLSLALVTVATLLAFYNNSHHAQMEVDTPATEDSCQVADTTSSSGAAAYSPVEVFNIDGQEIRVRRPAGSWPQGQIQLPGRMEDGTFYISYYNMCVSMLSFSILFAYWVVSSSGSQYPSDSMKRPELVALCREFSLGVVGKMANFKEKLTGFSENVIRWRTLIPGARCAHRGVREGRIVKNSSPKKEKASAPVKKAKKLKLSMIRRNELMGTVLDASGIPQRFAAERSKDMRTLEEKNNLLRWAKKFFESHPYVPPSEVRRRLKMEAEAAEAKKTDLAAISEYLRFTKEGITGLTSMVGTLLQRVDSNAAAFSLPSTPGSSMEINSSLPAPG
ncbi:hypothetical protein BDP27DRAFT_1433267 [Rhodocollybia butyracea]|uniref:Uncharacterized protein n=1 Tax=Rhodocollybia butyracea TaxID=206335 RepID=A0A9P5P4M9_9AGAR|nr:hypothetical protein BDP27DRAFT_1433267 [Rhodocollybia butyracea]